MSIPGIDGTVRGQVGARLLDLSESGALLQVPAAMDIGIVYDVALDLGGETLWVQADVRRSRTVDGSHEVGVEFVGVDPHDLDKLKAFVERNRR